jgi:hypothetical protein
MSERGRTATDAGNHLRDNTLHLFWSRCAGPLITVLQGQTSSPRLRFPALMQTCSARNNLALVELRMWGANVEPMSLRIDRPGCCKRLAANLGMLAYATVFCLSVVGDGVAFERRAPAAGRLAAARSFAPNLGRNARPAAHRPFLGAAGFTGIPPRGETKFVSNEMVFHAPSNVSAQVVDAAARRLGLVTVSSQNLTLSGGTLFRFRIDNGRQVSDVVRELEAENIGVAQPNYIYQLE